MEGAGADHIRVYLRAFVAGGRELRLVLRLIRLDPPRGGKHIWRNWWVEERDGGGWRRATPGPAVAPPLSLVNAAMRRAYRDAIALGWITPQNPGGRTKLPAVWRGERRKPYGDHPTIPGRKE